SVDVTTCTKTVNRKLLNLDWAQQRAEVFFKQFVAIPGGRFTQPPSAFDRLIVLYDSEYEENIGEPDTQVYTGPAKYDPPTDYGPKARANSIECFILQALLPGEHGFRFFPSFYRHVFDTMQRIPITGETRQDFEIGGGATVFDNLIPTGALGL